jgi:D-xylose transport system permease protein
MSSDQPNPETGEDPGTRGAVVTATPVEDIAPAASTLAASSEVVADSLGEYATAWWRKVRSGDSGVLPVVIGLVAIIIVFELRTSLFLSAGNIVNLFNQAVVFIMFAIGEVFVLLLGEIDLSMVFVAGIGAGLMAALVAPPYNLPWWLAILAGLSATTAIGLISGTLITRLRLPSFIVTLAGYIGWQGVMIWMFDTFPIAVGGVISISNRVLLDLVGGNMSPTASWIVMAVVVVGFAAYSIFRDIRRKAQGLVTPPMGLTL